MTQDLYYYESGYVDSNYFVYTADAESLVASSGTMTATVGVIKNAVAEMTVQATVSATISHIEGADLFAFSEASLALQVSLIRDNNVTTSGVFTVATDASRVVHFSADDFSNATVLVGDNLRVRFAEAATDAAFSLTADISLIPGGVVEEGSADLTSEFTIDAKGSKKAHIIDCALTCEFTQTASGDKFSGLSSSLEVNANTFATVNYIAGGAGAVDATVNQTANADRIRSFEIHEESAFTPTLTVDVFKNSFAVLDAVASLNSSVDVNKTLTAALISTASVSASAEKLKIASATLNASTTVTVTGTFANKRPRSIINNGGYITTSNKKFGSASYYTNGSYADVQTKSSLPMNGDYYINVWLYIPTLQATPSTIYKLIDASIADNGWEIGYRTTSSGVPYAYFGVGTGSNFLAFSGTGNTKSPDGWSNWEISRSGTTTTFKFTNQFGSETLTSTALPTPGNMTGTYIRVGRSGMPMYVDELFQARGVSQVYSRSASGEIADGALSTTDFLYHFNGSYLDDTRGIIGFASNQNAEFNLSASAVSSYIGSAQLDSQTNLLAVGSRSTDASANIQSEGFLVAAFGRIRPFADLEIAEFQLNSQISVLNAGQADLSSTLVLDVTVTKNLGPVIIGLENSTQLATDAQRLRDVSVDLTTVASTLVAFGRIRPFASLEDVIFTVDAQADVVKPYSASLVSTATQTTDVNKVFGPVSIDALASTALSATPVVTSGVTVTCDVISSVVSAIGRIRPFASLEDTQFNLSANIEAGLIGQANLNAVASVAADATKTFGPVFVDASAQTALAASPVVTSGNSAFLEVNAFALTANSRLRAEVADLEITASVVAQVDVVKVVSADLSADFAQTTDATKVFGPVFVDAQVLSQLDVTAYAIPSGTTAMFVESNSTVVADRLRDYSSQQSVTASATADVIVAKTGQSSIDAQASLNAQALRIKQIDAAFDAVASELAAVAKIGSALIDCAVASTMAVDAVSTKAGSISLDSSTSTTVDYIRIKPGQANLPVEFTQTTDATATQEAHADLNVIAQLTADADEVSTIGANLTVVSNMTVVATKIANGISLEASAGTMTVSVSRTRLGASNVTSTAALYANPGKQVIASAALQVQGFVLTVGRDINLASAEVWRVPADTNVWVIKQETNEYIIPFENRQYLIKD